MWKCPEPALTLLIGVAFATAGRAQEPAAPVPEGGLAVITDGKGQSIRLTGIQAHYGATGAWVGPPPFRTEPTIFINMRTKEGDQDKHEQLRIPLAEVREFAIEDWTDRATGKRPSRLRISKRDGSSLLVTKAHPYRTRDFLEDTVEETGPGGEVVKSYPPCFYTLVAGDAIDSKGDKGGVLELWSFRGRRATAEGVEADVEVSLREIRSISFQ